MRTFRLSLLLLAAVAAYSEDRALLVGIGKYSDPKNNLPGIDKDVNSMNRLLISNLGFQSGQIRVLMDEQATEHNIRSQIQSWLGSAGPNDRAVFYYSGHGSLAKDTNGVVGVLVPYDIAVRNGALEHALPGPELGSLFQRLSSQHMLVVIDACHSGHMETRGIDFVPKFFKYDGMPSPQEDVGLDLQAHHATRGIVKDSGNNFVLLAACRRSESAGATSNGSVLTVVMTESFKQLQAARRPVTVKAAHNQIAQVLAQTQFKDKQHPEVSGNDSLSDYNWSTRGIIVDNNPPPPPPQPQPQPQPRPTPPAPRPSPPPAPTPRPQPAPQPGVVVDNPPGPGPSTGEDWELLSALYGRRTGDLPVNIGKKIYHAGEALSIEIQVPADGYINVLSMGRGDQTATILFPNQYVQDNHVSAGTLLLPGKYAFMLEQDLPNGMRTQDNELVVLFTTNPVNFYNEGEGKSAFRNLGQRTRSTVVKPLVQNGTAAGVAPNPMTGAPPAGAPPGAPPAGAPPVGAPPANTPGEGGFTAGFATYRITR